MSFKPLNNNVLLEPKKNQAVFKDSSSGRELQFAVVKAICEGSILKLECTIVYNPRNVTTINYEGNIYNVIQEQNIIAII